MKKLRNVCVIGILLTILFSLFLGEPADSQMLDIVPQ